MTDQSRHDVRAKIALTSLPDTRPTLVELRAHEALSKLFSLEATVACADELDLDTLLGGRVVVTLERGPQRRVFNGIVNRCQRGRSGARHTLYHLSVVPWVWHLTRDLDFRIFQHEDALSIVTTLLNRRNVDQLVLHKGNRQPEKRTTCVQYRESTWAFATRLLEEEGYAFHFEHTEKTHLLVISNNNTFGAREGEERPVPCGAASGVVPGGDQITSLRPGRSICPDAVALDDYYPQNPTLELAQRSPETGSTVQEQYDVPGRYHDPKRGKVQAELRLQALRVDARHAEGSGTCLDFFAGRRFKVAGHSTVDQEELLLATEVSHRLEAEQIDLDCPTLDLRRRYHNTFRCIPAKVPFRPARRTPRPSVRGVETATVVGGENEELHTDRFGRVKVRFHWDRRDEASPDQRSCWIRVSQAWAGRGYGAHFLPRVGHEVVVSFEHGDPDRPLITGRLYNGHNPAPLDLPRQASRSTLLGRSTPDGKGGNELTFEDKRGAEQLILGARRDLNVTVRNNETRSVRGNRTTAVSKDDTSSIDGTRHTTISDDDVLTLADGDRTLNVMQGDLSTFVGGDRFGTVGGDDSLLVQNGHRRVTLTRGNLRTSVTNGNMSETVSGSRSIRVGSGPFAIECGRSRIVLDAGGTIEIQGADSLLQIGPRGIRVLSPGKPIAIKGRQVDINS